jgi:hypothetical protein
MTNDPINDLDSSKKEELITIVGENKKSDKPGSSRTGDPKDQKKAGNKIPVPPVFLPVFLLVFNIFLLRYLILAVFSIFGLPGWLHGTLFYVLYLGGWAAFLYSLIRLKKNITIEQIKGETYTYAALVVAIAAVFFAMHLFAFKLVSRVASQTQYYVPMILGGAFLLTLPLAVFFASFIYKKYQGTELKKLFFGLLARLAAYSVLLFIACSVVVMMTMGFAIGLTGLVFKVIASEVAIISVLLAVSCVVSSGARSLALKLFILTGLLVAGYIFIVPIVMPGSDCLIDDDMCFAEKALKFNNQELCLKSKVPGACYQLMAERSLDDRYCGYIVGAPHYGGKSFEGCVGSVRGIRSSKDLPVLSFFPCEKEDNLCWAKKAIELNDHKFCQISANQFLCANLAAKQLNDESYRIKYCEWYSQNWAEINWGQSTGNIISQHNSCLQQVFSCEEKDNSCWTKLAIETEDQTICFVSPDPVSCINGLIKINSNRYGNLKSRYCHGVADGQIENKTGIPKDYTACMSLFFFSCEEKDNSCWTKLAIETEDYQICGKSLDPINCMKALIKINSNKYVPSQYCSSVSNGYMENKAGITKDYTTCMELFR